MCYQPLNNVQVSANVLLQSTGCILSNEPLIFFINDREIAPVVRLFQSYVKKFQYRNAEMSQLWETFDQATGSPYHISDVMDTWTRQMGFPVVIVRHMTGSTEYLLNQTRFLINPDDQYDAADSPYG